MGLRDGAVSVIDGVSGWEPPSRSLRDRSVRAVSISSVKLPRWKEGDGPCSAPGDDWAPWDGRDCSGEDIMADILVAYGKERTQHAMEKNTIWSKGGVVTVEEDGLREKEENPSERSWGSPYL